MVYSRIRLNASTPALHRPGLVRQPSAQSPFASPRCYLSESEVPSTWKGITLPSLLLRTHPPVPNPPPASGYPLDQLVFAGYCQSPLGVGLSRRYLCVSFPTCLDPYPGCSWSAFARFFLQDIGLPRVRTGSALRIFRANDFSARASFRGCSHSLRFRPAGLLATLVVPTV